MFCRYAKVQLSAYPSATSEVQFDDIVPKATSTRRVAAAAFYHCLGLFELPASIFAYANLPHTQCSRPRT